MNTSQGILRLIGRSRAPLWRKTIVCKRTIICHEVFSVVTFGAWMQKFEVMHRIEIVDGLLMKQARVAAQVEDGFFSPHRPRRIAVL